MDILQYPVALIVMLGVLVTFHELGHYVIARWSGVRVVRFSIGFGRPLWSRVDGRGTEWVIAMIPLGGYVRMLDEREPGEVLPAAPVSATDVSFTTLTVWWRLAIAFGGPAANFCLAVLLYWVLVRGRFDELCARFWVTLTRTPRWAGPVFPNIPKSSPSTVRRPATGSRSISRWRGEWETPARSNLKPGRPGQDIERVSVPDGWHRDSKDPDLLGSHRHHDRLPRAGRDRTRRQPGATCRLPALGPDRDRKR